ncbi:hypothetical protein Dole_2139 [Desulfosudis oleivorans Hxd3]|uniref:Gingipain domain-containing protein n=2 Tax=Desulfosudis TaxID=2904716 RepID=A8ZUB1_DESOH|nr:hypothetical protein Dole_2139 [Desulfosudis oleivorans Hxd3]
MLLRKYNRAVMLLLCLLLIAPAAYAHGWRPARSLETKAEMDKDRQLTIRTVAMSEKTMVFEYAMPGLEAVFAENSPKTATESDAPSGPVKPVLGNAAHRSEPGMPVLPVVPARIVLPEGQDLDDVWVTPGKKTVLPGKYLVAHGQTPYPRIPGVKPEKTEKNRAVYESDDPYPGKLVEIVGVQKKRGVSILLVNLYPVVYRPKSGTLSWYETLTLTVTTKPADSTSSRKPGLPYRSSTTGMLDRAVENPEMVNTYTDKKKTEYAPAEDAIYPRATARYVLITSQAIIDDVSIDPSVADFIAHRQAQGLTTAVVSIDSVLADDNYTGRNDAETLRNFIIYAYENLNTEYVLLGGDTGIIPPRTLWCEAGRYEDYIPSDLYYQCLDGDFNFDGDEEWGERTDGEDGGDVDLMAEIFVGRASAENAAELSNFFSKTMAYETGADDAACLTTSLMCGEYLGFGGIADYAEPGLEEIRLGSDNHGYTTAGFAAFPNFTVDTLYDSDSYEWPAAEIINDIDSNAYSIIVHDGHGLDDQIMKLYNADADALVNTNFIFAQSQACFSGNYEGDCIAEHLTTSTRHGMFAVVFNSREGWGLPYSTDSPSQRLAREFWDACFGEGLADLGAINTASHEDNLWDIGDGFIRWSIYETNLLGDPATVLRGRLSLSLEIPANAMEGDVRSGRVQVFSVKQVPAIKTVATDLLISLTSSDTTEVTVPASVTIRAGESEVSFDLTVEDDLLLDDVQTALITASAPGFIAATAAIDVEDNDTDTDDDGLSDDLEAISRTDRDDADTDDDGIFDGDEDTNQNGTVDPGETDPCNPDTDGDGIQDGTELGYTDGTGLDTDSDSFQPDLDPNTTTDPLDTDTDGDGLPDGQEDANRNGRVDAGETDPSINVRPTANAGADQAVDEGDRTTLDGTGSFDIDDGISSHVWTQTAGPTVTIANSHTVRASFTAPDVEADQTLTFRLSVRDRAGQLTSDTCTVTVRWDGIAPPDNDTPPAAGGGGGGCFIEAVR